MDVGRREVGALGDRDADCSRFLLWSLERKQGGVSYSRRGDESFLWLSEQYDEITQS